MQQLTESIKAFAKTQIESGKTHSLYQDMKDAVESSYLEQIMIDHHGNQTKASEALGLNRATLRTKLKRHGLM